MRKIDPQTGRSAEIKPKGRAKNWKPEAPFILLPLNFLESYAYRALSAPARKILDFLFIEHLRHGGNENGNLAAPYSQLANFKISSRDIPKAFAMLEAFGIITRLNEYNKINGRYNTGRYFIDLFPDREGNLPNYAWKKITPKEINDYLNNK